MTFKYLRRIVGGFCIGLVAAHVSAESQSQQHFICALGSTKRIVTIITFAASDRQPRGACRVDYTKDGETKTLWTSGSGHAYCAKRATLLVTKLVEAHYACRPETVEQPGDTEAPGVPPSSSG